MAKSKHYHAPDIVAEIVASVEAAVPTMKVKTASTTRAGNKVQARVTYRYEGGKQVGYVSRGIYKGSTFGYEPIQLIEQALRLHTRVEESCSQQRTEFHSDDILSEVREALTADPETLNTLIPLCDEVQRKMQSIVRSGKPKAAKKARNQIRARKSLSEILDFALLSGISEDELRTTLKEAVVRNVMDS